MKEHTGKNKIFIVIIICLCAVIIAGLIYFMKLKGGSDSAFKPDLDSNAKTQTADDTGEKPTGIRIPGYPSITIEADKKDVQMNLMNPEGNPCYFTFEIVLNDTDETIYTSKMVEPGKAITEVTLEERVVIARGVNSLTTVTEVETADLQKIKINAIQDQIEGDIYSTINKSYIGNYSNSYDNKCLLITAIKGYLRGLEATEGGKGWLKADSSTMEINVAKQKQYP